MTRTYVSNIKSTQTKQGGKRRRRKTKKSPRESTPVQDVWHAGDLLFQAVDLVMKAGLKEAKTMVEVAGRMVERINQKK